MANGAGKLAGRGALLQGLGGTLAQVPEDLARFGQLQQQGIQFQQGQEDRQTKQNLATQTQQAQSEALQRIGTGEDINTIIKDLSPKFPQVDLAGIISGALKPQQAATGLSSAQTSIDQIKANMAKKEDDKKSAEIMAQDVKNNPAAFGLDNDSTQARLVRNQFEADPIRTGELMIKFNRDLDKIAAQIEADKKKEERKLKGRKLSEKEVSNIADMNETLITLQKMDDLFDVEFVGFADATMAFAKERTVGISDAETNFRTAVAEYRNLLLKLRSGGAVTPSEAERLLDEIPVLTMNEKVFKARVRSAIKLLKNRQTTRLKTFKKFNFEVPDVGTVEPEPIIVPEAGPADQTDAELQAEIDAILKANPDLE